MSKFKNSPPLSRVVLLALFLLMLLFQVNCTLEQPGMPIWDVKVAIPFSVQRYGLDSLISRPDELRPDIDVGSDDYSYNGIDTLAGGLLKFTFHDTIEEITLADSILEYNNQDTTDYSVYARTIEIGPSTPIVGRLPIEDIFTDFEESGLFPVDTLFIPGASAEVAFESFDDIQSVQVIEPDGGELELTMRNEMPLRWTRIDVQLVLNEPGFPLIGTATFQPVQPFSQQTRYIDLSGLTITPNILVFVDGYGPGQGMVELEASHGLEFTATYGILRCDRVTGIIEQQDPKRQTEYVEFKDEDDWITRARLTNGILRIHMNNMSQTRDSIYVTIPHLFPYRNAIPDTLDTLKISFLLSPSQEIGGTADTLIRLGEEFGEGEFQNDYLFKMELPANFDQPDPENQEMELLTTIITLGDDDEMITITDQDSVSVIFVLEDFEFEWLYGVAKNTEIELTKFEEYVDTWEDSDVDRADLTQFINFDDAAILVDLSGSSYNTPIKLELDVTAVNSGLQGSDRYYNVVFEEYLSPGQDTLYIGGPYNPDPRVVELLNIYPDSIVIEGSAYVGREPFFNSPFYPYNPYPLSRDDRFVGSITLDAPISLSIDSTAIIHAKVERLDEEEEDDKNDEDDENLEDRLRQVTVLSYVNNHLPFGGSVYMMAGSFQDAASAEASLVYDSLETFKLLDPITVTASCVDRITGKANGARLDTLITILDSDGVKTLFQDSLYYRQILKLDPTPGVVKAFERDYLEVGMIIEFEYRIKRDEDD